MYYYSPFVGVINPGASEFMCMMNDRCHANVRKTFEFRTVCIIQHFIIPYPKHSLYKYTNPYLAGWLA